MRGARMIGELDQQLAFRLGVNFVLAAGNDGSAFKLFLHRASSLHACENLKRINTNQAATVPNWMPRGRR
jgi:hypothetical protein